MADAAVEFLLDNVTQVLRNQANLISSARGAVENLARQLLMFKSFLKDTIKIRRTNETVKDLVREIREVVYQAEDIIDAFLVQEADTKSRNFFTRAIRKPTDLLSIANSIEALNVRIKSIIGDKGLMEFAAFNIKDDPHEVIEMGIVERQVNVVGLQDEAEKIVGYLRETTTKLDPISIIGMPGLGKTTLTNKIFHDQEIRYAFPVHMWVYVSQDFNRKRVFLDILKGFTTLTDVMRQLSDADLAERVLQYLRRGNFLIVLDDVWTPEDWEKLKIAFPKDVNMGKILITSRNVDVADQANHDRVPHMLRLLTADEGWLLLQYGVYGKANECPADLVVRGRLIVKNCGNLPLAIVVIGGILYRKGRGDIIAAKNEWTKLSQSGATYLNNDSSQQMVNIIALSYDNLPYNLRACFLYLGIFPEDFEIPAEKLTRMWIAEGFIQKQDGSSLEEIAEGYLDSLIKRNLLKVVKTRRDGRVKTCLIHDMLRQFCRTEARAENFLEEVMWKSEDGFSPNNVETSRRICIKHDAVIRFFSSKPFGPCTRSFVCLTNEEVDLPVENTSAIPAGFKLLRVLEVQPIIYPKLPHDLYQLVHLRYIVLSSKITVLPTAFTKLWNIQTLIVNTSSRELNVKADIWKMMYLRHFKTNAVATLPKPGSGSKEGHKIQTLGKISPECCNENKVFEHALNVKKLAIRGKLALIFDTKNGSFDKVGKLESLEKLKLLNHVHPSPASEGKVGFLPPSYQFPSKLTRLTLSKTYLEWRHMKVLGELENLQVLKLKDKAFSGNTWEVTEGGFRSLQFLYLERMDFVFWRASGHNFPNLRSLELNTCQDLQEIPFGFADIPAFRILDVRHTINASRHAKKISEEKKIRAAEFSLSIFPSAYAI